MTSEPLASANRVGEIQVTVTQEATKDSTVYLAQRYFLDEKNPPPPRVVLTSEKRDGKGKACVALATVAPQGSAEDGPAGVPPALFLALGGMGPRLLVCTYRAARFRDRVELSPGGKISFLALVVSFAATIATLADAAVNGALAGATVWILFGIFLLNSGAAWFTMWQGLSKI
jgi:hypothetical protein